MADVERWRAGPRRENASTRRVAQMAFAYKRSGSKHLLWLNVCPLTLFEECLPRLVSRHHQTVRAIAHNQRMAYRPNPRELPVLCPRLSPQ